MTMTSFSDRLREEGLVGAVRREAEANPRVYWGLWAIAAVVALYLVVLVAGWAGRAETALIADKQRLVDLRTTANDAVWLERREQSETLRTTLAARLWTAETEGIAAASFEDWLRSNAQVNGLGQPQIRIANTQAGRVEDLGLPGVRRLTAQMTTLLEPRALTGFLTALGMSERLVVVDRLRVLPEPANRIEFELSIYVQLPEGG